MTNIATKKTVKLYRMSTSEHECPWGLKAVQLLQSQGIEFEDHKLKSKEETAAFKAKHNVQTTPQVFFGDERIGGYTDLAEKLNVEAVGAEYSYTPVIAVFSSAGLMAFATSIGLTGFMGFSLSLLATLKLMDMDSFAESFAKYDLITQKVKPYAKIYPFAELALALGFLSGIAPLATGITSLFVGVSGGVSVIKAVYIDKLALNCACVGGNSKAPLSIVSFTENAIMAIMGGVLLFNTFTGEAETTKIKEAEPIAVIRLQDANN